MTDVRVFALSSVALALLATIACQPWEPEPRVQSFALVNAHQQVACEGCHPYEPPFTAEVETCAGLGVLTLTNPLADCITCHECDRPVDHYPGRSCGDAGCHATVEPLWVPDGGGTVGGGEATCTPLCHGGGVVPGGSPGGDSHDGHLLGTTLRLAPMICDDCHPPGDYERVAPEFASHDDGVHDVVMLSPVARYDGAIPAYAAGTCSGVYCHGATMTYPPVDEPEWDDPTFDALGCEECHFFTAPPADHSTLTCEFCHQPTVDGDQPVLADRTLHMDGCADSPDDETPSGLEPCP